MSTQTTSVKITHAFNSLLALARQNAMFRFADGDGIESVSENEAPNGKMQLVISGEALNLHALRTLSFRLADTLAIGYFRAGLIPACAHQLRVMAVVTKTTADDVKGLLESLAIEMHLELNLVEQVPRLSQPGLLVMDMDSTVIDIECIDEIAKLAGVGEQVSEVTELAMQGKLDFAQSLTQRVGCLKGADHSILEAVRQKLPLMPGIGQLVSVLHKNGWKIAIASGGFTYFADYLAERLSLDAAVSNELDIQSGQLTGRVNGRIIDAQAKAETLLTLAEKWKIPASQTIAMGDGANDLVMMDAAGLGVAYHAKPLVRQKATANIRFGGLDTLLTLLD